MKPLALNRKRMVAGVWAVVFRFAMANELLAWGFLGESAKLFRIIVMGAG